MEQEEELNDSYQTAEEMSMLISGVAPRLKFATYTGFISEAEDVDYYEMLQRRAGEWITVSAISQSSRKPNQAYNIDGLDVEILLGVREPDGSFKEIGQANTKEISVGDTDVYKRFRLETVQYNGEEITPRVVFKVTGDDFGRYRLTVARSEAAFADLEWAYLDDNGGVQVHYKVNEPNLFSRQDRNYHIRVGDKIEDRSWDNPNSHLTPIMYVESHEVGSVNHYEDLVTMTYQLDFNWLNYGAALPVTLLDFKPDRHPFWIELDMDGVLKIDGDDEANEIKLQDNGGNIEVLVDGIVEATLSLPDIDRVEVNLLDGDDSFENATSLDVLIDAGQGDYVHNGGTATMVAGAWYRSVVINAGTLITSGDLDLESVTVDTSAGGLLQIGKRNNGASYSVRVHGASSSLPSQADAIALWDLAITGFYTDIADGVNDGGGVGINLANGGVIDTSMNALGLYSDSNWAGNEYLEMREVVIGDLNGDNEVNFDDFLLLSPNFSTVAGMIWEDGDLDGDGDVDFADFLLQSGHHGVQFDGSN